MSTLTIGPEHGTLTLRTGVEGRAAKAGHALTVAMTQWSATVDLAGEQPTAVTLRVPLTSFEVVAGEGGLKPLSDKDKRTIKDSALETLSADRHPEIVFTSRSVTATADGYRLEGDLEVAGSAQPTVVDVTVAGGAASATVPVVQTAHGVKPYTGLMGGLRVRDRVDVVLSATLPG